MWSLRLRFDTFPTSLFCHRLDNVHWTESQQLLMEVQSQDGRLLYDLHSPQCDTGPFRRGF